MGRAMKAILTSFLFSLRLPCWHTASAVYDAKGLLIVECCTCGAAWCPTLDGLVARVEVI